MNLDNLSAGQQAGNTAAGKRRKSLRELPEQLGLRIHRLLGIHTRKHPSRARPDGRSKDAFAQNLETINRIAHDTNLLPQAMDIVGFINDKIIAKENTKSGKPAEECLTYAFDRRTGQAVSYGKTIRECIGFLRTKS